MNINDIIKREHSATLHANIHRNGKQWVLYKYSAYRLWQLMVSESAKQPYHNERLITNKFRLFWFDELHTFVPMISITDEELGIWFDRSKIRLHEDGYQYFDRQSRIDPAEYKYWTEGLAIQQRRPRTLGDVGAQVGDGSADAKYYRRLKQLINEFDLDAADQEACGKFIMKIKHFVKRY